ncbi:hypothetical protein [Aliikangiella sp. IMCC44359]|uniref:hypothetical protein n=1 Tax=Aliikangiella sp. IMCC44359 TaxID=3459125 RepID=UPI00403ADAB3
MKMINNYLNSLESYLPEELKSDVRNELEASIYAQIDEQTEKLGRDLNEKEQEELLLKIGHPMRIASAYLPNQNLVNQDYFPAYKKSLKIALIITLIVKLLINIPTIVSSEHYVLNTISFVWVFIDTALWVFATVTLIFYLMQKYNTNLDEIYAWSPKDIKDTHPKLSISRLETTFEILVTLIFIAWWNDMLQWPTTLSNKNIDYHVVFSIEWSQVLWSVNLLAGISILVGLHKLFIAGWNKITLSINLLTCLATFFILYQISNFEQYIIFGEQLNSELSKKNIPDILNKVVTYSLYIIAAVTTWDLVTSIKKLTKN